MDFLRTIPPGELLQRIRPDLQGIADQTDREDLRATVQVCLDLFPQNYRTTHHSKAEIVTFKREHHTFLRSLREVRLDLLRHRDLFSNRQPLWRRAWEMLPMVARQDPDALWRRGRVKGQIDRLCGELFMAGFADPFVERFDFRDELWGEDYRFFEHIASQLEELLKSLNGDSPLREAIVHYQDEYEKVKENRDELFDEIKSAHKESFGCPQPQWKEEHEDFFESMRELRMALLAREEALRDVRPLSQKWAERTGLSSADDLFNPARLCCLVETEIDRFSRELWIPTAKRVQSEEERKIRRDQIGAIHAEVALDETLRAELNQEALDDTQGRREEILDEAAARMAQALFEHKREAVWRTLAAAFCFALIALHSPFCNRPRTFLACAAATTILAAWRPEVDGLLNDMTQGAHRQMERLVGDHYQDKALIAFGAVFPTMWLLIKIPVLGRVIGAASSVGTAILFGTMMWRFQKKHRQIAPGAPGVEQETEVDVELVKKIAKLAVVGGFLLVYPMTTNSHLAAGTMTATLCLSAASRLFRNYTSEERVERLWRRIPVGVFYGLGAFAGLTAIGFAIGYAVGRLAPGPLNVDLEQICGPAWKVLHINKLITFITGVATGHYLWEVEDHLFERRPREQADHSPLDGARNWLDGLDLNPLAHLRRRENGAAA